MIPETKMVTCPRCGEEVEESDLHDDHCDNCEDWVKCDHCDKWIDTDSDENESVDGEIWCRSCADDDAYWCENCEGSHATTNEVTVSHRGDTQYWCDDCVGNDTWTCNDCGGVFSDSVSYTIAHDERVCNSCIEDHYDYCGNCDEYRHHSNPCDCSNRCEGVAEYGEHGKFVKRNTSVDPKAIMFGAEMEIYSFGNRDNQRSAVEEFYKELGHDFAFPTEDGSLDDTGVEFISHPMSVMDWMESGELEKFMEIMSDNDADVSGSSGCHLTTDRSSFVSDEALKAAITVVTRFRGALLTFSESDERGSYCLGVDLSLDPIDGAGSIGKYSCVNIKRRESLVEFRVPGMTLDVEAFRVQIQLYNNLIAWANAVCNYKEAYTANWKDIFMPVIGNCEEFAKVAEATKEPKIFNGLWEVKSDAEIVMIDAIPCYLLGYASERGYSEDHDSFRTVEGTDVEVGDAISNGIVTGIATVRATGFKGTITRWKNQDRSILNVVGGYGFSSCIEGSVRFVRNEADERIYFEFANVRTEEVVESIQEERENLGEVQIFMNTYREGMLNGSIALSIHFEHDLSDMFTKVRGVNGALQESPVRITGDSDVVGFRPKFDAERVGTSLDVVVAITRNGDDGIVSFSYGGNVAKFVYINSWGKF